MMRTIFVMFFLISNFLFAKAQNDATEKANATGEELTKQGVWFLFSTRTEEQLNDEVLTKIDFFKKDDVSSIFFDKEDVLYSVFSKDGSDMWEDRWRMVDDTHFVMVSPVDQTTQLMNILELSPTKLVIRNCTDIQDGSRCVTHTYFASKSGWLPDKEIDELNTAGIIEMDKFSELSSK